jgi:hypothetical protein
LVRTAIDEGRDPEPVVRQALEIGAAILLHGRGMATVDAVSAEVDRLLALLDEKSRNIERLRRVRDQVSSARGLDWESSLGPVLDAAFEHYGDEVEATGATRGTADDLVGDYRVTVNPRDTGGRDRHIVFECKTRKKRPSLAKALEELDEAMLNRDAQVAVMIFANRAQSPIQGSRPMRVYHGNRILVVYDPENEPGSELALDVACALARTLAIAAEREDLTLDRGVLADKLNQLANIIERGGSIKRGLSTAYRGLDTVEEAYEKLAEEATAIVLELMDRL